MESKPWGFIIALILSVGVSAAAWLFFRPKRLV
jgi:magnesium transporter